MKRRYQFHVPFSLHCHRSSFQETLLKSQTEASLDGILVVATDGRILLHNQRFVSLWEIPDDVVATRSDHALLSAVLDKIVDPIEFMKRVQYLYEHPNEKSQDEIILKSGRTLERYSAPICSDHSICYGRVWFFRDISERKQANQAALDMAESHRIQLQSLFTNFPAPVSLVMGDDLVIVLANRHYSRIFGGDSVVGKPIHAVLCAADAQVHVQAVREAYGSGATVVNKEVRLLLAHGNERAPSDGFFDLVAEPLRRADGAIEGVITFGYDVTELVRARQRVEELLAHVSEQQWRLEAHVAQLQKIENELQQAVTVRDEFLSIASHELKTPVTTLQLRIQSILHAAEQQGETLSSAWVTERLDKAYAQVQRLIRLIDSLLAVSRISSGRLELELEEVNLSAVVYDVVERFSDQAAKAGCQLHYDRKAEVLGYWDRLRLEQVITNLISNAIKYGREKPIDVVVSAADGIATIAVHDDGIGISKEHQNHIFERFERAVSERQYGGFGLGLWITRQIVEALGGTISVESELGNGATFTVRLPKMLPALESTKLPHPLLAAPHAVANLRAISK